jgi:hypothetical protein
MLTRRAFLASAAAAAALIHQRLKDFAFEPVVKATGFTLDD